MSSNFPMEVAIEFNKYINSQDLDKLCDMMAEDHTFLASDGDKIVGKENMTKGWKEFFERYLEYRNIFKRAITRRQRVILVGYSTCSSVSLDGPAIGTAKIRDGKVAEWRVYTATEENRKKLDLNSETH